MFKAEEVVRKLKEKGIKVLLWDKRNNGNQIIYDFDVENHHIRRFVIVDTTERNSKPDFANVYSGESTKTGIYFTSIDDFIEKLLKVSEDVENKSFEKWFEIKDPQNVIIIDNSKVQRIYPDKKSFAGVYQYPIVKGYYKFMETITRPELVRNYRKVTITGKYITHGVTYTNGIIDVRVHSWTTYNERCENEKHVPEMIITAGKDDKFRELSFQYGSGSDAGRVGRKFSVSDEDKFFEEFREK